MHRLSAAAKAKFPICVPRTFKRKSGITLYYQLYLELGQCIDRSNVQLPSETALMARYGVSRSTVRNALSKLEAEGRILRRRGSGSFPVSRRSRRA